MNLKIEKKLFMDQPVLK